MSTVTTPGNPQDPQDVAAAEKAIKDKAIQALDPILARMRIVAMQLAEMRRDLNKTRNTDAQKELSVLLLGLYGQAAGKLEGMRVAMPLEMETSLNEMKFTKDDIAAITDNINTLETPPFRYQGKEYESLAVMVAAIKAIMESRLKIAEVSLRMAENDADFESLKKSQENIRKDREELKVMLSEGTFRDHLIDVLAKVHIGNSNYKVKEVQLQTLEREILNIAKVYDGCNGHDLSAKDAAALSKKIKAIEEFEKAQGKELPEAIAALKVLCGQWEKGVKGQLERGAELIKMKNYYTELRGIAKEEHIPLPQKDEIIEATRKVPLSKTGAEQTIENIRVIKDALLESDAEHIMILKDIGNLCSIRPEDMADKPLKELFDIVKKASGNNPDFQEALEAIKPKGRDGDQELGAGQLLQPVEGGSVIDRILTRNDSERVLTAIAITIQDAVPNLVLRKEQVIKANPVDAPMAAVANSQNMNSSVRGPLG